MLLDTLRSFYQKHRKNIFFVWFFVALFFVLWEGVFANEDLLNEDDAKKITEILNFVLAGAAIILWLVTSLISMFLYPGWVNGSLFDMQLYFRDIWILISNVVYFLFAGILIIIAFMNIIWKWEWTWELKQAMPKFIVWVLIVPFSWFFVQFILSITSIFTVWVLTLPYDVFQDRPKLTEAMSSEMWKQELCTNIIIDLKWTGWGDPLQSVVWWDSNIEIPEILKCWDGRITIKDLLDPSSNTWNGMKNTIYWVINIYTYWILKVQNLDTIKKDEIPEWIQDLAKLIFKIVFDLLFVIVYLLLMVALFLALFVRIVRLWIYMMMSPAFGLLYFFWKWSEWVGSDNAKFSIKEFIALAMVPVYVSAALAFGLVFIMVAWSGINQNSDKENTIEAWGFSLTLIGVLWDSEDGSTIWQLIVQVFWIVILWIAVMAALRSSETTRAVVEPIAAFWKSVWELAAKAPTYAPIIPTWVWADWKMNRISATWLASAWSRIEQSFRWEAQSRWSDFADKVLPNQWWPTAWIQDLFNRSWIRWDSVPAEKFKVIDNALKTYWSDILKDQRVRQKFEDELSKVWIKAEITNLKNPTLISKALYESMDTEAWMINHNVTSPKVFEDTYFNQSVVDKSQGRNKEPSAETDKTVQAWKIDTTVRVEVTDEIFKEFTDKNTVPNTVIISIANKVSKSEPLSTQEMAIKWNKEQWEKIEELLTKIKEQSEEE